MAGDDALGEGFLQRIGIVFLDDIAEGRGLLVWRGAIGVDGVAARAVGAQQVEAAGGLGLLRLLAIAEAHHESGQRLGLGGDGRILDRDGVINRAFVRGGKPYPPKGVSDTEILPGVGEALRKLHEAGYLLVVVTNQPDVARGTATRAGVDAINGKLARELPIDEFRTCFHDDADGCDCRKPLPGALLAAAREHGIDLARSYMVGDRWRDVEAGRAASSSYASALASYVIETAVSAKPAKGIAGGALGSAAAGEKA